MQIRIEGTDLPGRSCGPSADAPDGYRNIHVGVQRRGKSDELLGLTRATRLPRPGQSSASSAAIRIRTASPRTSKARTFKARQAVASST
jgi:hypothetical protein